jgi:hypothetical protein
MGYDGVGRIYLTEDWEQWQPVVNTVNNLLEIGRAHVW